MYSLGPPLWVIFYSPARDAMGVLLGVWQSLDSTYAAAEEISLFVNANTEEVKRTTKAARPHFFY